MEIFGLIGGTLATMASDGAGLVIVLPSQKQYFTALDAEKVIRETTEGAAGMDDVLALLVGDFPMDGARIQSVEGQTAAGFRVRMEGPAKTVLDVWLDPDRATLRKVQVSNEKHANLLKAEYSPYQMQDGYSLPDEVLLEVPSLELTIELRYKSWTVLDAAPPVFSVPPPEGFLVESLETAIAAFSMSIPPK